MPSRAAPRTQVSFDAWVRELRTALEAESALRVRLRLDTTDDACVVPTGVLAALRGASREACRNAVRHAGVDEVELNVHADASGVRVQVVDHGRPISGALTGFGIKHSILGRMATAGGHATVTHDPRDGTTVTLTWSPRAEPQPARATTATHYENIWAATGNRRVARRIVAPMVVAHLILAARHTDEASHPLPLAMLAPTLVVVLVCAVRSIETRAPTVLGLTSWSCGLSALTGIGLYLAGPGATQGYASWPIALAELPLFIFAYFVPLRLLWLLTVPQLLTVWLSIWIDPSTSTLQATGALQATVTPAVCSCLIGAFVSRAGRVVDRERRRLQVAMAASHEQKSLVEASDRHLAMTRDEIAPWLDQIAEGSLSHSDPKSRERARTLQHLARDDLYIPGFYTLELRRQVQLFRTAGGRIDIRPGFDAERDTALGRALLAAVLPGLSPEHQLRLTSSTTGTRPAARLVVIPPLPQEALAQVVSSQTDRDLHVESDAYATTLTLSEK